MHATDLSPLLCAALSWLIAVSCGNPRKTAPDFDKLTSDFVYGSLALSPSSATQAGYHIAQRRRARRDVGRLQRGRHPGLARFLHGDAEPRVCCSIRKRSTKNKLPTSTIMKNNIGLSLLELETIQSFKHNPTVYVELAGNALFNATC